MNYLAHGFRHLADPWFVAGTALPDWLRVLDRRARVPVDTLAPHVGAADARLASLARGALRHLEDDRVFHSSAAFAAARREVADVLRGVLPEADGHRPSFVAHLVVEVQLDASLAAATPRLLDDYYAALATLAPDDVEAAVLVLAPCSPDGVARIVRRFVDERFLADYADPAATVRRLDRVVRGVGQPGLPADLASAMPAARACVEARRDELLTPAIHDATSAVMLSAERDR
jgi:hypothetical protein